MAQLSLLSSAPGPTSAVQVEGPLARARALLGGAISTASALAASAPRGLPACIPALDDWLGGWPRPGIVEIAGLPGSGRLAPLLPGLARLTRQGSNVVVVDPEQALHPPGLGGVDLARLVLVRPPRERAAWAAEQVARSGAVEALLLLDLPPLGRAGLRLARAAEAGGMTIFVVAGSPEEDLPAALRLRVEGWEGAARLRLRCTRSRNGRREGERVVDLGGRVHRWTPRVAGVDATLDVPYMPYTT